LKSLRRGRKTLKRIKKSADARVSRHIVVTEKLYNKLKHLKKILEHDRLNDTIEMLLEPDYGEKE
jgi:hypothetical protein